MVLQYEEILHFASGLPHVEEITSNKRTIGKKVELYGINGQK
jgi:hypothetical protein